MRRICMKCEIEFEGYGHNGLPLVNGRVCDNCNLSVILERLRIAEKRKEVKE